MKPKHVCPQCKQEFTRKWNMRQHCRKQHNYDPAPNAGPSPEGRKKAKTLTNTLFGSIAPPSVEKFFKMLSISMRFQKTGTNDRGEDTDNSLSSIEHALDYLLDNFVVVRKKEFKGISGYFCKKCVTFQYRYITNLWQQKTAKDEHLLQRVHTSSDASGPGNQDELRIQAGEALIELTNSLFAGEKIFTLYAPVPFAKGPVIKLDSVSIDHWAGAAIMKTGQVIEDNSYLNGFLMRAQGTYAQIIITSGPFNGTYFIAVQKAMTLKLP